MQQATENTCNKQKKTFPKKKFKAKPREAADFLFPISERSVFRKKLHEKIKNEKTERRSGGDEKCLPCRRKTVHRKISAKNKKDEWSQWRKMRWILKDSWTRRKREIVLDEEQPLNTCWSGRRRKGQEADAQIIDRINERRRRRKALQGQNEKKLFKVVAQWAELKNDQRHATNLHSDCTWEWCWESFYLNLSTFPN